MKTILEFITLTKGVEYLIAIAFLFGFIAFWQFMYHREKRLVVRIVPVVVMMLGIGILGFTCAIQGTATTTAPLTNEAPLLNSPVLVDMYGPASFDHVLHQSLAQDCTTCHHYSGDKIQPCKECHNTPFNPNNLNKPGIAHVFHLRCISCHMERQVGPTQCTGCHSEAAVPPLSVPHPLTGSENCFNCHRNGDMVSGVPQLSTDHSSVTSGVCHLCHEPVVEESALATGKLSHETIGRENCLLCHGEGIGEAAKVPMDHTGRTNETCLLCHKP